jgi:tetratricopeptide (TPR) repeat protein
VLVPAALLDLPTLPHEDFPHDPFSSADARDKTLAAARGRGAAYLDGAVARRPDGFEVRLVLRSPGDREMGLGEGHGVALDQAIRAAMAPLVRADAIPHATAVDPEVAVWSGVRDVGLLVALTDWDFANLSGVGVREEEARLAPRRAEIGPRWVAMKAEAASRSGEGWDDLAVPSVDRSSPAAFARSAPVHALLDRRADAGALAGEANVLATMERSATGRAALAYAEALLRARAGDYAKASALLFTAIQVDPSGPAWNILNVVADLGAGQSGAVHAYAAWWPEDGEAWNIVSISDAGEGDDTRLREMHRAHVLCPGEPLFAVHESIILVELGRREEARAIAAELLSQGGERDDAQAASRRLVAGEYVLAAVEASEGRFDAALARARRVLASLPAFGSLEANDVYLATLAMELGMLLGRTTEVAEDFVRRFLDPEPPRLRPGRNVPGPVASVCAFAPLPAAIRCFERLGGLVAAGFFREDALPTDAPFLQGAEAYARGDYAAATTAWRPMARMPLIYQRNLLPDAFDRAGEADLGRRVDAWDSGASGSFNGVSLAHYRQARRLLAAGHREEGETLARRVLDAWSVADAPVPAVAELRRLLAARRPR